MLCGVAKKLKKQNKTFPSYAFSTESKSFCPASKTLCGLTPSPFHTLLPLPGMPSSCLPREPSLPPVQRESYDALFWGLGSGVTPCAQTLSPLGKVSSGLASGGSWSPLMLNEGWWNEDRIQPADAYIPLSSTRIPALDLDQKSKGGGPLTGRIFIRQTEILSMLSKKQKWRSARVDKLAVHTSPNKSLSFGPECRGVLELQQDSGDVQG